MNQSANASKIEIIQSTEDAVKLCNQLQEIAARMTDLMQQETGLLKADRPRDVVELQEDKLQLTRTFLQQFASFKANSAFITDNAPDHAVRLRKAFNSFGLIIEENLNAVEAAKAVSQSVVDVIHSVARKADGGPTCYGRDAVVSQTRTGASDAIALDRSL